MLGQVIKDARNEKDWTQSDLAQKVQLSVGYISNIEKGYVNPKRGPVVPSDDSLNALANALGVPVSRFHSELGRSANEESARPMMTFVEQKLKESPGGTMYNLTPDQADQLVSELEEFAELRITQVQRQSQESQLQTRGKDKRED